MVSGFLLRGVNGYVKVHGIDHGGWGKILSESDQHIAIKWPGSMCWVSRGHRKWFPGETAVCVKSMREPVLGDRTPQEWVEPIILWENVKGGK